MNDHDPFGLRSLDVAALGRRPGTKWHRPGGRLAAWVADMDFPVAPAVRDRLVERASTDVGYPDWPHAAVSPLRERFVDRMVARYGWRPDRERLVELNDVVQGVRIAIHHLTEPGDGVVLHTPAYPPFFAAIEQLGRRVVRAPWPFDVERLAEVVAAEQPRLLLLCHPHNPVGHVFERDELAAIAAVAERHDLQVVSDEIHAELTYAPRTHVPFESLGPEVSARTVTITSASKAFNLAGLRWAIMHAGSEPMHDALRALPSHYFGAPNLMAVEAIDAAWSDGGEWAAAVMTVLDENRRRLVELLADHLPGVRYRPPAATYLAWLDCRELGFGDDPAAEFARRGVELSHGPSFGPEGRGHVRLNFATSPAVLAHLVATLATP
ncbi:MAG: aminotransferase class I/II-fold pyridoxal phosphate-dependent enzyme [Ilumatobacteraceae bacterium]